MVMSDKEALNNLEKVTPDEPTYTTSTTHVHEKGRLDHPLPLSYMERNHGLESAKTSWVLFILHPSVSFIFKE
ncbi:59_t:CDS:2 [Entrophospora sp. SA101]|nr:59_t:CDS:2 [Entrophospora sp. SA101]